jgi:hypothetical protein
MTQVAEVIREYLGWCPNTPVVRTTPAVLVIPSVTVNPAQPGSDGYGSSGRIRRGIDVATGSIRTLIGNRHLLWFSLLAGLAILFLIAAEAYIVVSSWSAQPFLVGIPIIDSFLIVDTRLFLLQAVCISCFNLILAGLVIYRSRERTGKIRKIRDAFSAVNPHTGTLATLSLVMAVAGTILTAIATQTQIVGKIVAGISMTLFYLPYAYYVPDILGSALFSSAIIMAVTISQFLVALYVVPVIVLENRGLLPAMAGSFAIMKKTWREILGCLIVLGVIIVMVATIAFVIGQSPLLLNHDYDFFLQISRGQVLMTAVCYGFILAFGILMAAGSTILGIAVTELYASGTGSPVQQMPETGTPAVA